MFPRITPLVKNILIINVLMFLASMVSPVFRETMTGFFVLSKEFQIWQPITSMFMHADFQHILFNMFGVFIFGSTLEKVWGAKRFLIFYMFTGLGAFALHQGVVYWEYTQAVQLVSESDFQLVYDEGRQVIREYKRYADNDVHSLNLVMNTGLVGASGALFGLLFAFGYLFPNTRLMLLFLPVPIKAKWFVLGYALLELYLGFNGLAGDSGDNVAHFAHLGGMLFGFILIKKWQTQRDNFY
ncbi:MAG: rhomboid family intramembrane serine protease [Flavobacteriales bacterium]|nr:rhomboid family intramembrane serine protease [Flavobacteriales bacterium]